MTTSEITTSGPAPVAPQPGIRNNTRPLGALYFTLPFGTLALYLLWMGVGNSVLNVQVAAIVGHPDPEKMKWPLFWGAILASVGNPLFGMLSDRTRSRFGSRAPWILFCGLLTAGAIVLQAQVESIALLGLTWGAIQFIMNGYQAAITAVMPDRVPAKRYGIMSGILGMCISLGTVLAALVFTGVNLKYFGLGDKVVGGFDGFFVNNLTNEYKNAYYFIAIVIVAAVLAYVFLSPEQSTKDVPREPFSAAVFFGNFKVSPKQHPDFVIALVSRMGIMLGYFVVLMYTYFVLIEYIKVAPDKLLPAMGSLMALNAVLSVVAAVVIGPIVDKVGRIKPFVLASGVVAALSMTIPFFSATMGAMVAFQIVNGLAFGVYTAVDMALITKVLPNPEDAGKDMGLINLANAGPQILAPFAAIWVVKDFDLGYKGLFMAAAIVSLGGALLAQRIKSVK